MNNIRYTILLALGAAMVLLTLSSVQAARTSLEGDFRLRAYNDRFTNDMDGRGDENYMRYLARIRSKVQVSPQTTFYAEFTSWIDNNPLSPTRNIAGTGKMQYGISQIFAELKQPNVLFVDLLRLRVGRQQFPIGEGLSLGESYYYFDRFDGAHLDLYISGYALSLFGAIVDQNLSTSGLYPDPGSEQLYVGRLSHGLFGHDVMGYAIYHKLKGQFNDSYVVGGGVNGERERGRLTYFVEGAYQRFNVLDGLPKKAGIGYMAGIGYRWNMGPFRSVKVETRYAAYQGDDSTTADIEMFSPLYPSFFWGNRVGYVSGSIGGDYPFNGRNPEGTRLWWTRAYVIPYRLPKLRIQAEYLYITEWVDNDGYDSMDSEVALKFYYEISTGTRLELRFAHDFPNEDYDRDMNGNGAISWAEDRVSVTRFMVGYTVNF